MRRVKTPLGKSSSPSSSAAAAAAPGAEGCPLALLPKNDPCESDACTGESIMFCRYGVRIVPLFDDGGRVAKPKWSDDGLSMTAESLTNGATSRSLNWYTSLSVSRSRCA